MGLPTFQKVDCSNPWRVKALMKGTGHPTLLTMAQDRCPLYTYQNMRLYLLTLYKVPLHQGCQTQVHVGPKLSSEEKSRVRLNMYGKINYNDM